MNRSTIEDMTDNTNNHINNSITNEEKLKPPITDKNETSIPITGLETMFVAKEPKDPDGYENPDDVNLMTRRIVDINDKADAQKRKKKPINYAAKKTVAQGMMDIALITSNANQLRNIVEYPSKTETVWIVLILIVISLVLQLAVGVSLIFMGRFDTKGKDKAAAARVNKWMMSGVFLITIINIFIAVFSTGRPVQIARTS